MRRKILFLFAGMLFVLTASAQDVIKMKDGKEIQAKISEITQDEIKYKNFDYQDGPTFTINKSDVSTITYSNGMTEEIKAAAKPVQATSSEESGSFWKPSLWTNQKPSALAVYADLGGAIMTGAKIGIQGRIRRFEGDIFYTTGVTKFWWELDGTSEDELEYMSGGGFGTALKVLLPAPNSRTTVHVGLMNEIQNLEYVYRLSETATDSWETHMVSSGLGGGLGHYMESGLFFRASGYFGLNVFTGGYQHRNITANTSTIYWVNSDPWVSFYGTLEIAIGYEFPIKK